MTNTFRTDGAIEHLNEAINSDCYSQREIRNIKAKKANILKHQRDNYELVIFSEDCFNIHDLVSTRIIRFEK